MGPDPKNGKPVNPRPLMVKQDSFWNHGYLVFDDIHYSTVEYSLKSFCGMQRDFTLTGKYVKEWTCPGGVPSIFLLNNKEYDEEGWRDFAGSDWGLANVDVIFVYQKLYFEQEPFELNLL